MVSGSRAILILVVALFAGCFLGAAYSTAPRGKIVTASPEGGGAAVLRLYATHGHEWCDGDAGKSG